VELKAEDFIVDVNISQSRFRVKTFQSQRASYTTGKTGDMFRCVCKEKKQSPGGCLINAVLAVQLEAPRAAMPGSLWLGGPGAEPSAFGHLCSQ